MNTILHARRHHQLATATIVLIAVTLITGTVGCGGGGGVEYNLAISSTAGGSVTTPGEGTFAYEEGEAVNLLADADEGYQFVNWTGDVDDIVDVAEASTTITMKDDYSITATFAVKQYSLVIHSTEGGSVTDPGEEAFTYDEGEVVNLAATPDEYCDFVNWTGDVGTIADVEDATTTITINDDYSITANFGVDLYFEADVNVILDGPVTLPPEQRNPCFALQVFTNIITNSVQVDLPDGRSIVIPRYSDVFGPRVDQATVLRFSTCEPGMPTAGGEYVFTGLDGIGEPIPGAIDTDIWVGVEPPEPPNNVRAEVIEDGLLVSWDESQTIPGSFEPTTVPQLGCYQLHVHSVETEESVYGAGDISVSPHLVPQDKADFTRKDYGLSLSEMEDGTYCLSACVHSIAPQGSLGKGLEYMASDYNQSIIFTIQDGEITIE
jgi:hypothetical protein